MLGECGMKLWSHKGFRIILIVELICLVASIALLLKPNTNISYPSSKMKYDAGIPMENFAYSSYPGIYMDNSMYTSDSQESIDVTLSDINLLPGSYQITINYSSSNGDNTFTCSCDNDWKDFWKLENVALSSGEDQSRAIQISSVFPMKKVNLSISYNGNGYLYLSSAEISRTKTLAVQALYYCLLVILLTVIFNSMWIKLDEAGKRALYILTCATFICCLPLFGILLGVGDDLEYHLLRIDALADGFRNGQFPVRISTYWNKRYGYASSIFYNDLFLTFPALLRLLGISVQSAYKQYVIACNLATVCVAWYSFRKVFSRRASLIGTLVYLFQPYRLSCLYKRAAVGEYTAMIFFPLIFWGLYHIYSAEPAPNEVKGFKRIVYNIKILVPAILGYSGIISSHVISSFLVGVITVILCIVLLNKTLHPRILFRLLAVVCMVFLVNAWYIVPMADSMRGGISANNVAAIRHIQKHGTYAYQLFDIFPNGDGQSYTAQDEISPAQPENHDMSYSAGVEIAGIIIWLYYISTHKANKSRILKIGNISGAICTLCLFMTTVWFPWDFLTRTFSITAKIFGNIQYPWRMLGITAILSSINIMCLIHETNSCPKCKTHYVGIVISAVLSSMTLVSAMYFMHSYEVTANWKDYTGDTTVVTTHLQEAEYLPDNTKVEMFDNPNPTTSTSVSLSDFHRQGDEIILTIDSTEGDDSYIDVPFLYYPGYVARYQTSGQMLNTVKAPDNRVRVVIPSGYTGMITVKYRERMLWRVADFITVISTLGIIMIVFTRNAIDSKRLSA